MLENVGNLSESDGRTALSSESGGLPFAQRTIIGAAKKIDIFIHEVLTLH
jgi:hypothetical protein